MLRYFEMTYVYIYIYLYVYLYIYIYLYVYTHTHTHHRTCNSQGTPICRPRTSVETLQDQIAAALRSAASNVTAADGVTLDETVDTTLSGTTITSKRLLAPASGCPGRVEVVDI